MNNYADNNTLYAIGKELIAVKEHLLSNFKELSLSFYENYMILNTEKCHYLCLGLHNESDEFWYNDIKLPSSDLEIMLGVIIDKKLNFDIHKKSICKKAAQKVSALCRISYYLQRPNKKPIFTAMVKTHFS